MMNLLSLRIASLKVATAPSPYLKYGSVRCSLLPRTSSKIAKFIEDGLGFVPSNQVVKFSLSKMEKSIEDGSFFIPGGVYE